MNVKIIFASFALVFLAELGDKTQLTALAFSASSRSYWSVFLGTSLALVAATALAVACGAALAKVLPQHLLHVASGAMFVVVGLVLLVNQARKNVAPPTTTTPAPEVERALPAQGSLSAFILHQAIHFEEEFVLVLQEQAQAADDTQTRSALETAAREHATHAEALNRAHASLPADPDAGDANTAVARPEQKTDPDAALLRRLHAPVAEQEQDPLRQSVHKQEAAAEFYVALARMTALPAARDTFRWLAMEELRLARHLEALAAPRTTDAGNAALPS